MAPSGDGELAFTWTDKPHRVVYGLASACERAADMLLELARDGERLARAARNARLHLPQPDPTRRAFSAVVAHAMELDEALDAARNATQEKP